MLFSTNNLKQHKCPFIIRHFIMLFQNKNCNTYHGKPSLSLNKFTFKPVLIQFESRTKHQLFKFRKSSPLPPHGWVFAFFFCNRLVSKVLNHYCWLVIYSKWRFLWLALYYVILRSTKNTIKSPLLKKGLHVKTGSIVPLIGTFGPGQRWQDARGL